MLVWVAVLVVCGALVWWRARSSPYSFVRRVFPSPHARRLRVGVIGGGIAGAGAAWTLAESGYTVTVLEKKPRVGGNANTHEWELQDGRRVRTGLSVLAWPADVFRHYEALLSRLNVERVSVRLPFLVQQSDGAFSLNHAAESEADVVAPEYRDDMKRWIRMLNIIDIVTKLFAGRSGSLYAFSFINPFNLIPLRLFSRLFVSTRFWMNVVVPIYSTTFLTSNLNRIPCVIAPVMHHIIPLHQCPRLNTWREGSSEVFDRMLEKVTVLKGANVISVEQHSNYVQVQCEGDGPPLSFDKVIFACDAHSARNMLKTAPFGLRSVLNRVTYVDDMEGSDFLDGKIHRSLAPAIPSKVRPYLSRISNYVFVNEQGQLSNTFVLSSWVPQVVGMNIDFNTEQPFLVSYGREVLLKIGRNFQEKVQFRFAHPMLCVTNLICSFLMRFVHDARHSNVVFCGSWTTPGNGHDLSLVSGIAAAHAVGAQYPFHSDASMCDEFRRARRVVGL